MTVGRPPDEERSRPRAASQSLHGGGNFKSTVGHADDNATPDIHPAVHGTSAVKRSRRTRSELAGLHQTILEVCAEDHPLSVRGVFYRVMSTGAVEKTEKAYRAVQREVLKLRRAGDLPYEWIADGTRWHVKSGSWSSVEQVLDAAASSYRRALWNDQNVYVEIWSEKEAISSIVAPVTNSWDVPLMIARGFSSETFLWNTAAAIRNTGKPTMVYNLGDHDPSGVVAWEHIQRRLREFAPDVDITFKRIAVTEAQITELDLPTRPTKESDSRSKSFTGESVEVDAIRSSVLRELVESAITRHIDKRAYDLTRKIEARERRGLKAMANGWRP
jgi:hypothetical protein